MVNFIVAVQTERLPAALHLTALDPAAPVQVRKLEPDRESEAGLATANQDL